MRRLEPQRVGFEPWPRVVLFALCTLTLGGCSSSSSGDASGGSSAQGGAAAGRGGDGAGGTPAQGGALSQGGSVMQGGASGAAAAGRAGDGNSAGGVGGASAGSGNVGGASAGAGGNSAAGSGNAAGAGNSAGSAGTSSAGTCPSNATFCSGFEEAGLPQGARYEPAYQAADWANFMAIDSTQKHAGTSSLLVKTTGMSAGYSPRLLSVAVPGSTFWVRAYLRSDADFGQAEHNAFLEAMVPEHSDAGDPNNDSMEVAEQYCQVVLNHADAVVTSNGSPEQCGQGGALLAKDAWHCVEALFDGPNGVVQVYADGSKIIDKSGLPKLTYGAFNFGFEQFHGPARNIWYDDVAVAAARIGCD